MFGEFIMYPQTRMRRLRIPIIKDMIKESEIHINELIYPIFIDEAINKKKEIDSMPGIYRWPINEIENIALELINLGIKAILLFGIPINKNENCSSAYDPNGVIQKVIFKLKTNITIKNNLIIIADLCLCEYTTHGHCGILNDINPLIIDNDKTLHVLNKVALSYAKVGVDIIAPSGMMDGVV